MVALLGLANAEDKKSLGEKTSDVVEKTKDVAKDAGRAIKDTTRKATDAVKDVVTPDKDARKVEVRLVENKIEMPAEVAPGKTAFVVTNAGTKKHNFGVQGEGLDKKFLTTVEPNETKTLQVDLKPGTYKVYCPVGEHEEHGMKRQLTVK